MLSMACDASEQQLQDSAFKKFVDICERAAPFVDPGASDVARKNLEKCTEKAKKLSKKYSDRYDKLRDGLVKRYEELNL